MRDAAISLRALPEQRDLIDQAASLLGKSRSEFMLEAACDRAQAVMLDQVSSNEVRAVPFKAFVQAICLDYAKPAAPRLLGEALSSANAAATDRAQRFGHAYLLSLIADGSLLGSADLAQAWGVTSQALRQLADVNELVAIKVNNKLRFPIELARFDARSDAQRVSKRLAGLPAIEQVLFMLNEHPELDDKTASEAFRAGQGTEVLALANRVARTIA